MSNQKPGGYIINYKWDLQKTNVVNYVSLSSEWFTLENYDKIYFSMSLLKINYDYYCLNVHKKGIYNPETVKIKITFSDDKGREDFKSIAKQNWKNNDTLEITFNSKKIVYITCELHLNNIDFDLSDHHILSETATIPMNKYLLSPQYSDITIKIKDNDEELPAHKVVLAFHSSVFETMFNTDMKEAEENRFYFGEFDIITIKEVLRFMYTGNIAQEDDVDLLFKILACANMYQIEKLKVFSELKLILNMNVDNIIDVLVNIENLQVPKLNEKAKLYLECNSNRISLVEVVKALDKSKILFDFLGKASGLKVD